MMIETLSLTETVNGVPNNTLPVVIYRGVIPGGTVHPAVWLERHFAANGWPAQWRYGIYPFTHFHSNTHELLGAYAGRAQIQLGGETGPVVAMRVGDVVLIPAGVGHKAVETSADFMVVGAYPPDFSADLYRDEEANLTAARARIAQVPLPATDPLSGRCGGITTLWHNAEQA